MTCRSSQALSSALGSCLPGFVCSDSQLDLADVCQDFGKRGAFDTLSWEQQLFLSARLWEVSSAFIRTGSLVSAISNALRQTAVLAPMGLNSKQEQVPIVPFEELHLLIGGFDQ